jgi:hypothetical protein
MQTIAMIKLARLIAEAGNPSRFAQISKIGSPTLRLLVSGGSRPKSETIEALRAHGIEPQDWFTPSSEEAK